MATAGGVDAVSIAVAAATAAAVAGAEAATNTSVGSTGSGGKASQLSLTPRFTQEEKEILYSLFHQHEEVIDIKYRKKQRSKYCVRDAWDQIVREFNSHPSVGAIRNIKQIQKFWLNARLRKQYPSRSSGSHQKRTNDDSNADEAHEDAHEDVHEELVEPIKDEPEFQLNNQESSEHNDQSESYGEMELDGNGVEQMDDDVIEVQQQQQHHHQTQQQQLQQHIQQHTQQAAAATIQAQQISVDQISAEKLTLNDLLQFKRPREEIILQIKHPDAPGAQITIPSPTRITIPTHHQPQQHTMATITASGYNQQIISEIKPQQITLAQYQAQQQQQQLQQQQLQQQQQQLAQQQLVAAQQQQQHVKMQLQTPAATQFATSTPAFTCTTFNALPSVTATPTLTAAVPSTVMATHTNLAAPASVALESFEEKINYFRLKEAELRFKEEQVALEHKKIELNRAQDELKHLREIHRLQVEELRMKIRILQEEEKQLRKNQQS